MSEAARHAALACEGRPGALRIARARIAPQRILQAVMATQDLGETRQRAVADRGHGGSIGLVLLLATVLVAAVAALLSLGRGQAQPYIMGLLALLATIGVFSLFALASGLLRVAGKESGNPLVEAAVEGAFDGMVVTDSGG